MDKPSPQDGFGTVQPNVPLSSVIRRRGQLPDGHIAYYIQQLAEASKNHYIVEQRYTWPRNQHMTFGRQWAEWNPVAKRWFPRRPTGRDRRITSNHLLGRVSNMAARLVSNRPIFSVLPTRPSADSRAAARLGENILTYDWRDLDLYLHRYFSILQTIIYGIGIIKTWYDPDWGGVAIDYEELLDMAGDIVPPDVVEQVTHKPPKIKDRRYKGKIRVEALNPGELLVPPGIYWPILSLCPWIIQETHMTPEEVYERYDVEVTPSDGDVAFGFQSTLTSDINRFTFYGIGWDSPNMDMVPVYEYYEPARPVEGFEKGTVITVAGDKVLQRDVSQFEDGGYPFAVFPGVPEPGRFFPHAWVSDLVDPQLNLNRTRSRLRVWQDLLFYPKVLNPSTSGIPDKHFNSKLAVLTYEAFGGKPEFWNPPQPPAAAFNAVELDKSDMDMISSQFGFSRGQQQQGSPSGALAQLLVEQDASELGPLISMHARAWEYLGERLLELHRKFSGEQELLVLSGEGGAADVSYFSKNDIPLGLRVEVQEDSLAPRIKSARVQMMKDLTQQGFFGNVMEDAKVRRKLLEWSGQPASLIPTDTLELMHRNIARQENFALIENRGVLPSGVPVQRRPTDDDEIHLEVMLERANEVDSFEWPPETQQVFLAHMQEHQESIQQAQQQAQQQQLDMMRQAKEIETQAAIKQDVAAVAAKKIGGGGNQKPPEAEDEDGESEG